MVTPAQRRTAVTNAMATAALSERQACRFTGFARASQRYRTRRLPHTALRERLTTLALLRPRWGYRRLYRLVRREGWRVNRKLVYRLYRELGLAVRRRRRKRVAVARQPLAVPTGPRMRWSMDFVSDALASGRKFRALTIVDDYTRECPAIEVDHALSGERVVRVLERLAQSHGLPHGIVCDNGPEFTSEALDVWGPPAGHHPALHRAGQAGPERVRRKLQRPAAGRVPQRDLVRLPAGCPSDHRSLAGRLQPGATSQQPGRSHAP